MKSESAFPPPEKRESEALDHAKDRAPWVERASDVHREPKDDLARHVADHLVDYGMVIYMGPGTTNIRVAQRIFERQQTQGEPLDLVILTNNLRIFLDASRLVKDTPALFGTTQVISTGGVYQASIDSVVGRFAAGSLKSSFLSPHLVLMGASGVSFASNDGVLSYHFEEEIDCQVALASVPTEKRVLVCDHSKLFSSARWQGASVRQLLNDTRECLILTSLPSRANEAERFDLASTHFLGAIRSFIVLLENLYPKPSDATQSSLALRVVGEAGDVVCEISSSQDRAGRADASQLLATKLEQRPPARALRAR